MVWSRRLCRTHPLRLGLRRQQLMYCTVLPGVSNPLPPRVVCTDPPGCLQHGGWWGTHAPSPTINKLDS